MAIRWLWVAVGIVFTVACDGSSSGTNTPDTEVDSTSDASRADIESDGTIEPETDVAVDSSETVTDVTVDASDSAGDASDSADDASDSADDASDVAVDASDVAVDSSDTAVDSDIAVDSSDTAVDSSDTAVDSDIATDSSDTAVDSADTAVDSDIATDSADTAVDSDIAVDSSDTAVDSDIAVDLDIATDTDIAIDSDIAVDTAPTCEPERCDGLDNDCDGKTDEDFRSGAAQRVKLAGARLASDNGKGLDQSCGAGVCAGGKVVCGADGLSLVCDGDARAGDEVCNTLDDDCDGAKDEGFLYGTKAIGASCDGVGACGQGVVQCASPTATTCSTNADGSASQAKAEACDKKDNDCDGATDEDFSWHDLALGAACDGTGVCGPGVVECAGTAAATCSTDPDGSAPEATAEICDGDDDDCDGTVDDACVVPCVPESNATFCDRLDKECGNVTGTDNCGAARSVNCGGCSGNEVCGSLESNVCGPCLPETNNRFCSRLKKNCDDVTAADNCGTARTVDCGDCTAPFECGLVKANVCGCAAEDDATFCARVGSECGPTTDADNCGATRTAQCGACADDGFCSSDNTCLGPCGELEIIGCCDGDMLMWCASDTSRPKAYACPNGCGWASAEIGYDCGASGEDPGGAYPLSCDALEFPTPACIPESTAAFCARAGAACGVVVAEDNCGPRAADCGGCAGANQSCNVDNQCVTCGNGVVEVGEDCEESSVDCVDCRWNGYCDDSCATANNGVCEDFGYGATDFTCNLGSDCGDCGVRPFDCFDYPVGGTCALTGEVLYCERGPGASYLGVGFETCVAGTACAGADGAATCAVVAGAECVPGTSDCDGTTLRICGEDGHWATGACAGACKRYPLGAYCEQSTYQTLAGLVHHEYRAAKSDLTDWDAPTVGPVPGALVVSYQWVPEAGAYRVFDATVADADAAFALRVPQTPAAEDLIGVWALAGDDAVRFALADPSFQTAGRYDPGAVSGATADPAFWGWAFATSAAVLAPTLMINEASGGGPAHVFARMRDYHATIEEVAQAPGEPLAVWMQGNGTWSCGACFAPWRAAVGHHRFTSSLWMPFDDDGGQWSDAVIAHELGHWVMSSYGTSPGEGGTHYLGVPTLPGQAWSEGWATFFSALARQDPRYYDKQGGGFFWFDIDALSYLGATPFELPTADAPGYPDADDPVLQRMDENVVAGLGWEVARQLGSELGGYDVPPLSAVGHYFMAALRSPELNTVRLGLDDGFGRGYRRHVWAVDNAGQFSAIQATDQAAPMLADFLDALRCETSLPVDVPTIDTMIGNAIGDWPYPVNDPPPCDPRPDAPLRMHLEVRGTPAPGRDLNVRVAIERVHPDGLAMDLRLDAPAGTRLVGKARELIVDPSSGRVVRDYVLRLGRVVPKTDLVATLDVRAPAYGVHAVQRYRFGRVDTKPPKALPRVTLRGLGGAPLGRVIRVR